MRGQHPQADRQRRARVVRLHRHPDQHSITAAGHRGQGAVHRAVHRCRGLAHTVQPLCLPRARLVLRRDGRNRQAAHCSGHQAHRRLLSERQLRQGRPRRRHARAQAARPRAVGPRHRRAQHGRGRRRGEDDHGRQARRHRPDQRLQVLRGLHSRGAQSGFRRHLLQRVFRRHAGLGQRARRRCARRRRQPGDAVRLRTGHRDLRRVPGRRQVRRRRQIRSELQQHGRLCRGEDAR